MIKTIFATPLINVLPRNGGDFAYMGQWIYFKSIIILKRIFLCYYLTSTSNNSRISYQMLQITHVGTIVKHVVMNKAD